MGILKNVLYFFLTIQEKTLSLKLNKHLRRTASNRTSKTILSSNVTVTISAETQKNVENVRLAVNQIVIGVKNNPNLLMEYIKAHGTRVVKLANADKILALILEDEGLVTELKGVEALYLNIMTGGPLSFYTKPMFVLRDGEIEPYFMLHQFYKWYSLYKGLPGFDYSSQRLFKKYLNSVNADGIENLTLDELTGLKEAVDRDNEAIDFTVKYANSVDGSKKVLDKIINEGSAGV